MFYLFYRAIDNEKQVKTKINWTYNTHHSIPIQSLGRIT